VDQAIGLLNKALEKITAEFDALLRQVTSIENRVSRIESEIEKLKGVLVEYIESLKLLKDEYKNLVPIASVCVYTMQIVVAREDANLAKLQAEADKFRADNNDQSNPHLDQSVKDKQAQINLCRERMLQLIHLAAKGYIMVPVIELLATAALLVNSKMADTINSTLPNIRALLALIVGQKAMQAGMEAVKKAQLVEDKTEQALRKALGDTAEMVRQMPQDHIDRMERLKLLAEKVAESQEAMAEYSKALTSAVDTVNVTVNDITKMIATTARRENIEFKATVA
jgi:prefoldin subunit 5